MSDVSAEEGRFRIEEGERVLVGGLRTIPKFRGARVVDAAWLPPL
jgi:hypothetical protein